MSVRAGHDAQWHLSRVHMILALGLVAGVLLLSGAASAQAAELRCGTVVTKSVKLTRSLTGCSHDALIVDESGITIDLDGNTISGTGRSAVETNGFSHVRIEDGTVSGFVYGVLVAGGEGNVVSHITASGDQRYGIFLSGGVLNSVRMSSATDNTCGIVTSGGKNSLISDDVATGNGLVEDDCAGITVEESTGADVSDDNTADNGYAGINVLGSSFTTLHGDNAIENRLDGVVVQPYGILPTSDTTISDGTELRNEGEGIRLFEVSETKLTRDVSAENQGNGVSIEAGTQTTISREQSNSNGMNGISIDSRSQSTSVARSEASANSGDGIYAGGLSTTLTSTLTDDNGGHGIYAVAGVLAVRASAGGNVTPPQCVNVMCS